MGVNGFTGAAGPSIRDCRKYGTSASSAVHLRRWVAEPFVEAGTEIGWTSEADLKGNVGYRTGILRKQFMGSLETHSANELGR